MVWPSLVHVSFYSFPSPSLALCICDVLLLVIFFFQVEVPPPTASRILEKETVAAPSAASLGVE